MTATSWARTITLHSDLLGNVITSQKLTFTKDYFRLKPFYFRNKR